MWCAHRWVGVVGQWWVAVFESLQVLRGEVETQRRSTALAFFSAH